MNAFIEHHQPAIRLDYSCFDRILLNGVIQVLQNPACVVGFLKQKRQATRVTPAYFRGISTDYHHFVQALAEQRHVEILMPPQGRPPRGVGRAVLSTVARPSRHRRHPQGP